MNHDNLGSLRAEIHAVLEYCLPSLAHVLPTFIRDEFVSLGTRASRIIASGVNNEFDWHFLNASYERLLRKAGIQKVPGYSPTSGLGYFHVASGTSVWHSAESSVAKLAECESAFKT